MRVAHLSSITLPLTVSDNMKAVSSIVYLLLFAINASTSVRVKRGLSIEEQNKFLDALNADRQAIGENMGITFEILTYNKGLELKAENFRCDGPSQQFGIVPLKVNQDMKEVMDSDMLSRQFFNPKNTKIGCSKEKTCSHTFELQGKTAEFWGACSFGPLLGYHFDDSNTPEKNGMPSYEKYGELLGVGQYSAWTSEEAEAKSGKPKNPKPYSEWVAEEATVDSKGSPTGSSRRFISLTLFLVSIIAFYF
ncbi:hypothetical protein B9Z55_008781 [Caenorhabditis nigoni]|uniref:Uncharacterized protein n=1 Tax=Caenorhabditis nigoni TaxID=1611254 RepID=A0A2G5UP31_9PELO|nr:hypothetical protein B9Z55_008781 [Caenorhabditis nigoni]